MSGVGGRPLLHVVASAAPGDHLTAAARAICSKLERAGRSGTVAALHAEVGSHVEALRAAAGADVLVHSVDGGRGLDAVAPLLGERAIRLLHHGSGPYSDRRGLRAVRAMCSTAFGPTAAAREELRRLGFGDVRTVPPDALAGEADPRQPDAASVSLLQGHPGPRVVAVCPLAPGQPLDLLLAAFADVVTHSAPSATLSVCGPGGAGEVRTLHRRVVTSGLLACELLVPQSEEQVLARVDHADVYVALEPRPLDAYAARAARRGTPVISLGPGQGRAELASAVVAALQGSRIGTTPTVSTVGEHHLRRVLGL